MGTSVACLSSLTGSAGWVHGLLARVSLCWAALSSPVLLFTRSMCAWPSSTLREVGTWIEYQCDKLLSSLSGAFLFYRQGEGSV